MLLVLIALGGAAGAVSRYAFGAVAQKAAHAGFPVGTFAVNVVGCILVGVLAKLFMNTQAHSPLRALLIVGFCGGFTTFSAFSLEIFALMQGGEWFKVAVYVVGSLIACIAGTAIGFAMARPL